ncbi:HalOD1 output domain-containing protein [Salarchaeum japonicum]|uniref:HalOD1 output domain-containing protein n=1 Tax=Salarchaeum japonicum TaxID=555573 RepID=UPI003C70C5D4
MSDDENSAGGSDSDEQAAASAIVRHDWTEDGQPSVALVEAVAAATNLAPSDLPPLDHRIDPDALDSLLTREGSTATVSFPYAGATVTVDGNGDIEVCVDN